jgi:hypothetical protein
MVPAIIIKMARPWMSSRQISKMRANPFLLYETRERGTVHRPAGRQHDHLDFNRSKFDLIQDTGFSYHLLPLESATHTSRTCFPWR